MGNWSQYELMVETREELIELYLSKFSYAELTKNIDDN